MPVSIFAAPRGGERGPAAITATPARRGTARPPLRGAAKMNGYQTISCHPL